LHVGQRYIHQQLKQMNGTQTNLLSRMSIVESTQKTHPLTCPVGERVGSIEIKMAEASVEKATDKKWIIRLKPVVLVVGGILTGAIIIILLQHLDVLINKIK